MLWRLFRIALELNLKRLWYFRASLLLDMVSALAYAGLTIVFWNIIYTRVRPLPGWGLGETFAFVALTELFYALTMSVFIGSGKFWNTVVTGRIDTYLTRPVDARLLMSLITMRLENALRSLPSICLLVALALHYGARFTLAPTLLALAVVALGATTYAFLQMAGSWTSFWLGRSQLLDELTDSMTEFVQYPHTIFPGWVRVLLTTVVPLALAASQPALALQGSTSQALRIFTAALAVAAAWWAIQEFAWRRGLKRYDSFGG